jgi:two-component system nitrate/nitrite response regulator NarL
LVKILIVDDHAIFRAGLKAVLLSDPDFKVVGEGTDGSEALPMALMLQPDVILMDVMMPYSGLKAVIDVLNKLPQMKIIVLTISEKEADLSEAVKTGAKGYMLKGMSAEELISGVKSVASGGAIISPMMASKLLEEFRISTQMVEEKMDLTEREREVLGLVAAGFSNKEIAAKLVVGEPTVKSHLRNILGKLHLKNRSQAAVYATQKNLIV